MKLKMELGEKDVSELSSLQTRCCGAARRWRRRFRAA